MPQRQISIKDGGRGNVMYASNAASDGTDWAPAAGNLELSENDFAFTALSYSVTEYDSQYYGSAWVSPYEHASKSDYDKVEIWVRLRNSNDWFLLGRYNATYGSRIDLPANTVEFDVRHSSSFYRTKMTVTPVLALEPTEHVQQLMLDDASQKVSSIAKNVASVDVQRGGTSIFASTTRRASGAGTNACFELNLSKTKLKAGAYAYPEASTSIDVVNRTQDAKFVMSAFNYNNSGRIKPMTSGVFYNLLPPETSVAEGSIEGYSRTTNSEVVPTSGTGTKLDPGYYAVSYIPNWQGSGRTMMVVDVAVPDSVRAPGFIFVYTLHNTYENIVATGAHVENDVAFANTSEMMTPYDSITDARSIVTEQQLYESVEGQHGANRMVYAKALTNFAEVNSYTYEFSVTASIADDGAYSGDIVLTPGADYTYRLLYSQSDVASGSGVVMYDVLDRVVETDGTVDAPSGWSGAFSSIDVRPMQNVANYTTGLNCAPVVYYSTKPKDSFTAADFDITRTDVWSTVDPGDPSQVTAVAVDCSKDTGGNDFELRGQEYLSAYIHLQAPADAALVGQDAVNGALLKTAVNGVTGVSTASARVEMRDFDLQIRKSASPATGTQAAPTVVYRGQDMAYQLEITNSGLASAREVVVEDAIPAPLHASVREMTVSVADGVALPVSSSPRVSASLAGNDLLLRIHEVRSAETLRIVIPVYGDSAETMLMENTAHVRTVNGVAKPLDSETTYHKYVGADTLVVSKRIEGPLAGSQEEFEFRLRLWASDVTYDGVVYCTITHPNGSSDAEQTLHFTNGATTFKLKDGETAALEGVPIGMDYRVTEADYPQYTTSVVGTAEGTIVNDTPISVLFVNDSSAVPYVGVNDPARLPLAELIIMLAVGSALLVGWRIRRPSGQRRR